MKQEIKVDKAAFDLALAQLLASKPLSARKVKAGKSKKPLFTPETPR